MPGQEVAVARAQDAPGEGDPRRSRWLLTRSDRPIVPGSIALLTALAFVLARWQTWAQGDITRFILVGRHFATLSQHGRHQLVAMYLVSVNSRSPSCAPSRPMPDCFTPPNGAAGSDTRPRLSPTMPASSASDTRRPRLRSRV
jgi:hypothetical protein